MNKKSLFLSLAFGISYLWSGCIFMTVFFRLYGHYDTTQVTYISDVLYYIMQAMGIFVFALYVKNRSHFNHKMINIYLVAVTFFFGIIAMYTNDPIGILVSGALMNISIGCLMSSFLVRMAKNLSMNERGKCFALSYAIGSIGTYIISLPSGGNALTKDYIIWGYVALAVIASLFVVLFDKEISLPDNASSDPEYRINAPEGKKADRNIIMMALIPFFFMIINSFCYHFEQTIAADINIVFTRAFYSIGLIAAGIIIDKKRHLGAICAFLSLSFPLICLSFRGNPDTTVVTSILSYIFLGFINVYSVILFIDIGDLFPEKSHMATFGYGIARIGTAVGTTAGILLEKNQALLICITLILYSICGLIFFSYQSNYYTKIEKIITETADEKKERIFKEYSSRYGFNGKQTEVLRLLLEGYPNGEIAEKLFLAESTVKYHVKNILKITGFKNRNELISDYVSRL